MTRHTEQGNLYRYFNAAGNLYHTHRIGSHVPGSADISNRRYTPKVWRDQLCTGRVLRVSMPAAFVIEAASIGQPMYKM
jgi:hypothetical protein